MLFNVCKMLNASQTLTVIMINILSFFYHKHTAH